MGEKALLLDAAGVLLYECDETFLQAISRRFGVDIESSYEWFGEEAYEPFFSGKWSEIEVWQKWSEAMKVKSDSFIPLFAAAQYSKSVRRLSSVQSLKTWASLGDLYLVSDHRSEYIRGSLGDSLDLFQEIWISDRMGVTKRNDSFWIEVSDVVGNGENIAYIDDNPANLQMAKSTMNNLTCQTADSAGRWMKFASRFLLGGGG